MRLINLVVRRGRNSREDLLWFDGRPLTDQSHADRRLLLERLRRLAEGTLDIVPSYPATDLDHLMVACEQLDLEGVVLKRGGSRYRAGRSPDWRKVKTTAWRTVHLQARTAHLRPDDHAPSVPATDA